MGELSIEEKAKAYDEAIERARKINSGEGVAAPPDWTTCEVIFPELKESEDERIRKQLLNWFKDCHWDAIDEDKTPLKREDIIAWLEKQGSQNLANSEKTCKIEPKFKVGDWVIDTITKEVEQVIELTGCEYICSGHLIISFNNQHLLKRWTINDAKDGDVLSFNDGHGNDSIELIKSITEKKIEFWFCLTNGNRYEVFDGITPYTNLVSREDATPATKEQCDLLFQKMKDAGYEWDAEKKDLVKIEQSPAWSEEDEDVINHLLAICAGAKRYRQFAGCLQEDVTKYQTWLESLKERYTWKPSDEQMMMLEQWLKDYRYKGDARTCYPIFDSLYNDLKKLKG